jgi:hypothetical protein
MCTLPLPLSRKHFKTHLYRQVHRSTHFAPPSVHPCTYTTSMTPHAVVRSPKGKVAAAGEHRLSSFVALHHIHVDELLHADGHTLALAHSLWLTSTTSTRAHAHMRAERETEKETYRERERERGREGDGEKEREERERHRDRHRHRHRLTERRCSETPGAVRACTDQLDYPGVFRWWPIDWYWCHNVLPCRWCLNSARALRSLNN